MHHQMIEEVVQQIVQNIGAIGQAAQPAQRGDMQQAKGPAVRRQSADDQGAGIHIHEEQPCGERPSRVEPRRDLPCPDNQTEVQRQSDRSCTGERSANLHKPLAPGTAPEQRQQSTQEQGIELGGRKAVQQLIPQHPRRRMVL